MEDGTSPGEGDGEAGGGTDEGSDASTEEVDLDALLEAASGDDLTAQNKLEELHVSLGGTEKEVKDADSWEQVVGWIRERQEGGGEEASGPQIGQMYKYAPPDPKDKKKKLKAVEVEITAVNDDGTVDLQKVSDKKVKYKKVPAEQLQD